MIEEKQNVEGVRNEPKVAAYEPPKIETVLTAEDVEREALYGGISPT